MNRRKTNSPSSRNSSIAFECCKAMSLPLQVTNHRVGRVLGFLRGMGYISTLDALAHVPLGRAIALYYARGGHHVLVSTSSNLLKQAILFKCSEYDHNCMRSIWVNPFQVMILIPANFDQQAHCNVLLSQVRFSSAIR